MGSVTGFIQFSVPSPRALLGELPQNVESVTDAPVSHAFLKLRQYYATYQLTERMTARKLLMAREFLTIDDPAASRAADPSSAIPDEVVLQSSQERPGLFSILVDRYQAPFLRLAQRVVRDRTEAEDVVQEAFVKIYRYSSKFKKGENRKFSSWAYKIVLNTSITHYHKLRKKEWLIPEDMDPTANEARFQFKEALLDRETEEVVKSVLEVMPADLGALLKAYYLEDKPYKTIAAANGMSLGALKMRLFRARKMFKKLLV
ncbi:MAG: sigma-70 family RNA polymerase sigma factor [Candidatus Sungbacteria bacterium]|nr:sigma-70 family RNA polymerase sigma factor [Candidatus Sungbacteria bacterium]